MTGVLPLGHLGPSRTYALASRGSKVPMVIRATIAANGPHILVLANIERGELKTESGGVIFSIRSRKAIFVHGTSKNAANS